MKKIGLLVGILAVLSTVIGWALLAGQSAYHAWPDQGAFEQHG